MSSSGSSASQPHGIYECSARVEMEDINKKKIEMERGPRLMDQEEDETEKSETEVPAEPEGEIPTDVSARATNMDPDLSMAAKRGDTHFIKKLGDKIVDKSAKADTKMRKKKIERERDPRPMDSEGEIPTVVSARATNMDPDSYMAAKRGDTDFVKQLKAMEIDKCVTVDFEMIEKQIGMESDPCLMDPEGEIPTVVSARATNMDPDLYMAAKRGDTDFIKQLKAKDIEQNPVFSQRTPKLNSVLHIAASLGHYQFVEAILEYDRELCKKKNSAGELAFHVATSCGHLSTLKKLVSVSGSEFLRRHNNDGNTPLHLALINKYREVDLVLKTKYSEIADYLVETNPIVSYFPNKEHKSPLHRAAEAGDSKMVELMIKKADGINMGTVDGEDIVLNQFMVINDGNTPLHLALINKYREVDLVLKTKYNEIADYLVKTNPILSYFPNKEYKSPLQMAAEAGDAEMEKLMIEKADGINMRTVDGEGIVLNQFMVINDGNTPLHLALINKYREVDLVLKTKYSEIADYLVKTNPILSYFPNKEYTSPLQMAAEAGDAEMVKLMIEKADGINVRTVVGERIVLNQFMVIKSIAHTAITGKNIDVLDSVMSENPHRIKNKDGKGMTPLSYAASIGYLEGVRYLLNKYADYIYESDRNGFFPIHTASSRGHIKIVQEFIQRCPDSVELLNHQGRNILHVAAMSGKAKVVNYMLKMPELEMLINEKDKDGNTSLHLASKGGHPKVVIILTGDKRVDLKLLNDEGKTALDIALEYCGKVPSFQERLTYLALSYAGVSHAPSPSTTKDHLPSSKPGGQSSMDRDKETITENSQSSKPRPREAPNMDNYKDRVNTLLLVATLVATVTFAAGFTVPGGNDDSEPHKGMAKFLSHHLFQAFIISNTIAMYSSVTVAVALIWAQLGDLNLVIASLRIALPTLRLALTMVSLSFMTGSYLLVRDLNWLAYLVLIIGSLFILILTILFLPLSLPTSLPHPIFRYIVYYPFSFLIMVT